MHELSHTLGLDDLAPSQAATDLMTETLATGVRRLPSAQDLAALTPQVVTLHLDDLPVHNVFQCAGMRAMGPTPGRSQDTARKSPGAISDKSDN
jgi:hypothetical protein